MVMACANQLGPHSNLEQLAVMFERSKLPILAIGLGAQAKAVGEAVELTPGTRRWLDVIAAQAPSKAPNIGVRGEFSREQVERSGLSGRAVVTGCPSHFHQPRSVARDRARGAVSARPDRARRSPRGPSAANPGIGAGRVRRSLAIGLTALALTVGASAARAGAAPILEPVDPTNIEPVFLWARDRCAADDIPDAPFRAVRLDGHVVAFATHDENRRFVGADLNALRRDCRIVFSGQRSDKPEDYSDRVWISSVWLEHGRTIFALGHDEYQADRHPGRCRFSTYFECWYNAVVPLRSDDEGETFSRVGDRPIASIPIREDIDQGHPRGFFEPTNIIRRRDAFFALIRATAEGPQKAGTCLFRTDDLARPESWRNFEGEGFSANVDPYRDDVRNAKSCVPLKGLRGSVGSVVYAPALGVYVAVSALGAKGSSESGFYYSVSTDLIHWSEGRLFLALPTPWSAACGEDRFVYPSLVDPNSPSRNFDVVADAPYLYFVRQHVDGCQGTMQRDLVRVRLRLKSG